MEINTGNTPEAIEKIVQLLNEATAHNVALAIIIHHMIIPIADLCGREPSELRAALSEASKMSVSKIKNSTISEVMAKYIDSALRNPMESAEIIPFRPKPRCRD